MLEQSSSPMPAASRPESTEPPKVPPRLVRRESVGVMNSDDRPSNAEFLASTLERLRERIKDLSACDNQGFSSAYRSMAQVGLDNPAEASRKPENRLKNRYSNIVAYDHSRVVLPTIDDEPDSDYINANFVPGYNQMYIASQGPVPNSFVSFWRMVWHENVELIVMVTNEMEKGRVKCHRYWPDPTSEPPVQENQYGDCTVRHITTEEYEHFKIRCFEISCGGEKRSVRQFAFTAWPDHGVPLTSEEVLGFRNCVSNSATNDAAPILIHCSAGVGRTGTYMAIDYAIRQVLDQSGTMDIDEQIRQMRDRRNYMVQTEIQYIFIHRAVQDALTQLLEEETEAAAPIYEDAAALQKLKELTEAAAAEKRSQDEREQAMIEQAKLEQAACAGSSVENAKAVVRTSIKARMAMLAEAPNNWQARNAQYLQEWSERNQFDAEFYDLTSALTPVQSRLEALRQKGMLTKTK
eukprot:m.193082 g.193082  ORF g.193082 m.193082 type:complete len:465 (-) comp18282_c1_seq1:42-1436(-)